MGYRKIDEFSGVRDRNQVWRGHECPVLRRESDCENSHANVRADVRVDDYFRGYGYNCCHGRGNATPYLVKSESLRQGRDSRMNVERELVVVHLWRLPQLSHSSSAMISGRRRNLF